MSLERRTIMNSDYELFIELSNLNNELTETIEDLRKEGVEYAKAERDYKIALRKKALELRSQDMAITLIDKVVYGEEDVAVKRFERDIHETYYKTLQEKINTTKLRIRILDNQIARDYGQTK